MTSNGIPLLLGLEGTTLVAFLATYAAHSTALLAVAWLLARALGGRAPALQDGIWKVALLGALVTAAAQQVTGLDPWGGSLSLVDAPAPAVRRDAAPGRHADARMHAAKHDAAPARDGKPGLSITSARETVAPATQARPDPAGVSEPSGAPAAPPAAAGVRTASGPPSGTSGTGTTPWWVSILLLLWAAGSGMLLLRRVAALVRLRFQLAPRRPVEVPELLRTARALARSSGLRRPVRLSCSERLPVPIALGRREVCLPVRALEEMPASWQHGMLAHEMAHLRRRDPMWLLVASLVEGLFFFQPLNRTARRGMQRCAEYLCDDEAARHAGDGRELASCLAQVASWLTTGGPTLHGVTGMARESSELVTRVQRLVGRAPRHRRVPAWAGWLAGGLLLVPVLGLVPAITAGVPAAAAAADTARAADGGPERPSATVREAPSDATQEQPALADPARILGFQVVRLSEALAMQLGLTAESAVLVEEVHSGGPAAAAGLRRYDVIRAVDGRPLRRPAELWSRLAHKGTGEQAALQVVRAGSRHRVTIRVPAQKRDRDPAGAVRHHIRRVGTWQQLLEEHRGLARELARSQDEEGRAKLEALVAGTLENLRAEVARLKKTTRISLEQQLSSLWEELAAADTAALEALEAELQRALRESLPPDSLQRPVARNLEGSLKAGLRSTAGELEELRVRVTGSRSEDIVKDALEAMERKTSTSRLRHAVEHAQGRIRKLAGRWDEVRAEQVAERRADSLKVLAGFSRSLEQLCRRARPQLARKLAERLGAAVETPGDDGEEIPDDAREVLEQLGHGITRLLVPELKAEGLALRLPRARRPELTKLLEAHARRLTHYLPRGAAPTAKQLGATLGGPTWPVSEEVDGAAGELLEELKERLST